MSIRETENGKRASASVNKYLTFELVDEVYGIDILKVKEIIGIMDITAVPQVPDYVKGVINLRGKIIPVADLRLRLGFDGAETTDKTCIIVVDLESEKSRVQAGIVVDAVSEVAQIAQGDIEPSPALGEGAATSSIQGIAKLKEKVVILLNIDRVFAGGMGSVLEVA